MILAVWDQVFGVDTLIIAIQPAPIGDALIEALAVWLPMNLSVYVIFILLSIYAHSLQPYGENGRAFNLMRNVSLKEAPMAMTIVMFCVIPMLTYYIFGRLWLELKDYRLTKKGTA